MYTDVKALSDYELIGKCLNEDKEYFSELIARYKNLVFSIILRMVIDSEEANDLAQEVFLKAYKNLHKYYPEYKFSTWIMRITTNHVIDYRRKKHFDTQPIEDYENDINSEESPETMYIRKEQKEKLKEVVDKLPDMYKIPIVLYHSEGLSYQEISDVIDEPLSKVKNRIFRGRKMLKESLLGMKDNFNYGI